MSNKAVLISIIVAAFTVTGCLNDSQPAYYSVVQGVVVDGSGPVQGAEIHVENFYKPNDIFTPEDVDEGFDISFNSSSTGEFEGNLYRYRSDSLLSNFFMAELDSGEHVVTIPAELLSDGIYVYEIVTPNNESFTRLLFTEKTDSLLYKSAPFTTSNADGEFFINPNMLAFGADFVTADNSEFVVTDSIAFKIVVDSMLVETRKVKVRPNQENFFEFSLD
ncbi:MAG: hypothetical protein U5K71_01845 [Gracilimonas sp.]|nr:hypothetical protein [Gracilimonas sp.]